VPLIDKQALLRYVLPTYGEQEQERVAAAAQMPERAGRPEPWGVLYASPNPDQSRKACANCIMWIPTGECDIHAPGVQVAGYAVCGYHVFGQPLPARVPRKDIQYVEPEYSGLMTIPGGTNCARCRWFNEADPMMLDRGLCLAVDDPSGAPAPVEAGGCCARWQSSETGR